MKVTALAPWFGSNRNCAHRVGELLAGCEWVGVGFAGGMCELAHIKARTLMVNDLHRAVINLASALAHRELGPPLIRRLRRLAFHPDVLHAAQLRCKDKAYPWLRDISDPPDIEWAEDFFAAAWMGRNGTAGTDREFNGGLSVRWDAGGGDSATRFRSAVESLRDWRKVLARCTFTCLDVFAFLDKVQDKPKHGLYLDPPFPGPGDDYRHKFPEADQRKLAARLADLRACRVVVRYYDHQLIRELYPESLWTWHRPEGGKTQTNKDAPEVLLVNRLAADTEGASA